MARTPRKNGPVRKANARVKAKAKPKAREAVAAAPDVKVAAKSVTRILNCVPSANTASDWGVHEALAAGVLAAAPIPKSKDLREDWWGINDQGSTGSCVGWALADSVLRWHFVQSGQLDKSELMSPRFIWMAAKETDEFSERPTTFIETDGTSLKAALDVARKFGSVTDKVLPFGSARLYEGEWKTFYAIASQRRIANYFSLDRDLTAWRRWIAERGPILTRLVCDSVWMNAKATGGRLDVYDPTSARGGHAVALVGYDDDRFIVRNSWGTTHWGDGGFGYASNIYASAAFTEAYGVGLY